MFFSTQCARASAALLALGGLLALTKTAMAQTFAIDQQQNLFSFSYRLSDNTQTDSSALGQSFVPTFSQTNAVAIYLMDADTARSNGTTMQVLLHSGSITGAVLGTSAARFIPNNFQLNPTGAPGGLVTFLFGSDIALAPGSTYVFEAQRVSGDDVWVAALGNSGQGYLPGTAIVKGVPQQSSLSADLLFETGEVSADEPSNEALLLAAPLPFLFFRRRRRLARLR